MARRLARNASTMSRRRSQSRSAPNRSRNAATAFPSRSSALTMPPAISDIGRSKNRRAPDGVKLTLMHAPRPRFDQCGAGDQAGTKLPPMMAGARPRRS